MVLFFFIYLGIHTYHRTKTSRVSIEMGTQRPELSEGSNDPLLPGTLIMMRFLEDIDIRKALAPFHYALYLLRRIYWCFILVYLKKSEITALVCLTFSNLTFLYWMMYIRPYKTNMNNRVGIFVEACTLLITLCIFPYIRGWESKEVFEDFARYQVALLIIMMLMIPLLIMWDHFYKVKIMKVDYYKKPFRRIFGVKKPKKLKRLNIPDSKQVGDEEGEGEGEGDEEKKKEEEEKKAEEEKKKEEEKGKI